eukprot:GGOE01012418.1.p6 GENE.GGOE01012418.1~~GGOE01012418.1.p6  ORF type:complete len:136 (-),score=5.66 GGOE01012418.1:1345-1752(-)
MGFLPTDAFGFLSSEPNPPQPHKVSLPTQPLVWSCLPSRLFPLPNGLLQSLLLHEHTDPTALRALNLWTTKGCCSCCTYTGQGRHPKGETAHSATTLQCWPTEHGGDGKGTRRGRFGGCFDATTLAAPIRERRCH